MLRLDDAELQAIAERFQRDDEFVVVDDALSTSALARIVEEARALRSAAIRSHVPFVRKGGAVGYARIRDGAPTLAELYRDPAMLGWMRRLTGKPLVPKPLADDHSCTLYYYERRRDFMHLHYDDCGCERDASYTVMLGLVDRGSGGASAMRLMCKLPDRQIEVATPPGRMVVFCGSKLLHGVTPLGSSEERVVASLSYDTGDPMPLGRRLRETAKDSLLYFGVRGLRALAAPLTRR